MIRKNKLLAVVVVLLLLSLGWLLFRVINSDASAAIEEDGFRSWFWEKRSLDLIVQMVLVFAGALGITAILPVEDEDART